MTPQIGKVTALLATIAILIFWSRPICAAVTWPAGQLLPSLSTPASTQDLISLQTGFSYNVTASNFGHATGHLDSSGSDVGWLCQTGIDAPNLYMVYGPYDTTLPAGTNDVYYSMKIDNNTADNNPVAILDCNDATTNTVIASETITRQQFAAASTYETFTLPITIPAIGHSMEFRVKWLGASYLKVNTIGLLRTPLTESAVLFSSLKGVVNANQPSIFAYDNNDINEEGEYTWLNSLGLGYNQVTNNWTLITKYRSDIAGVVVYDDNQLDTINLATTIAGSRHALVAPPLYLSTLTASPYNLPILVDLRGKYSSNLAVYQDLYNTYWSGVTHRAIVGLNPTAQFGAAREYAVAINAAAIWLDPRVAAQNTLLSSFLSSMGAGTVYMGWWPDEQSGVSAASTYGIATSASDWSTNLSVFSGTSRTVNPKGIPPAPTVQNKIYVAFVMSDGDNLQYIEHHMRKIWNDPNRGKVPMGWTVSPIMLDVMPGVLNYLYSSATPNDCLLSGPSGYGYTYPNNWTNTTWLDNFIATSNNYCSRAGLRIITVWNTINGGINGNVGSAYATYAPSLLGLTAQNSGGGLSIYNSLLPSLAFSGNYCPTEATLESQIASAAAGWSGTAPLFLIVQAQPWQGLSPTNILNVKNTLSSNYVVVRPDNLLQLVRQANHLPIEPNLVAVKINAGGSAVNAFVADTDFSGGAASSGTTSTINITKVANPAPMPVYQTGRKGSCTYTIGGLTAGVSYQVRLDFAEYTATAAGQRTFNVLVNGAQVLTNFDIFAAAGGEFIANAQTFTANANSSGQITIQFVTVVNNALVSGIEVTSNTTIASGVHSLYPQCAVGERLDDTSSATTNGNPIQIWQQTGGQNQNWNFAAVSGGYNLAVNLGPYCLDAGNGAQGTQVQLWTCSGAASQKWTPYVASGGYTFVQGVNGLCMDVSGAGSANGTKVQSYGCNGSSAQTWVVQ